MRPYSLAQWHEGDGCAVEERSAQIGLKRLDAITQRWLRDTAPLGRAREVQFGAQGHEVLNLRGFQWPLPEK
jgi:hypothetical protein